MKKTKKNSFLSEKVNGTRSVPFFMDFFKNISSLTFTSLKLDKRDRKFLESIMQLINKKVVRLNTQQIMNNTKIETNIHISNIGAEISSTKVDLTEYGT
ncbi:hypothetical protein PT131_00475 [Erysipelothrix rhusiopathiae]|nr:hypothetical protein [Erysipelothrix rhusiopathiae]